MSISVQQLKRILGSFSQIVAKDVSGIKTTYATKKDVEGFAKLSDLNNTYIRKGDIHTEDYVTNVIFRDAYQNRLVKKTDLPALDTIATKQEISNAVAAIQVPSIEGLAKESEVEAKLADYAKTAEVAETYATKEAVNAINGLDADTIATLKNLSQHSDLTAIANKVDNVYTKAETDDKLATKADVTAIPSVEGLAKATDVESTYAKKSELPDVSGLATKQEVTDAVAGVQVPSIEGLAKASEVETTYAKKSELPSIEGLATKAEVTEAVTGLAKASEVAETYATKEAVNAVASLDSETVNSLKALAQNSDLTTVAEKVKNVYTKAETDTKLATKADVSAIPDVSGLLTKAEAATSLASKLEIPDVSNLATKAEVINAVSGIVIPSTDGLAKTVDVDAKLVDYAKKTELPSIEGLAKTTEVVAKSVYDEKVQSLESEISALKTRLATVASGTTEQRPTENLVVGQQYFDTTLGVPVFWNGTEWHNPFAKITTVEVEPH